MEIKKDFKILAPNARIYIHTGNIKRNDKEEIVLFEFVQSPQYPTWLTREGLWQGRSRYLTSLLDKWINKRPVMSDSEELKLRDDTMEVLDGN